MRRKVSSGRRRIFLAALLLAQVPLGQARRLPNPRANFSPGPGGQWVTLNDCTYLANRANDGDSFHVLAHGKEFIFRIYFVDAPETDREVKSRVQEQAKYFGTNDTQTLAVGKLAEEFTREKLSQPFTVRTCFQDALGRSRLQRLYAIVQTKSGDLAEQLIENGLGRIHGASANPVGLPRANVEWEKLRQLEIAAKAEKVGAWGATAGRMYVRSEKSQDRPPVDPFAAFFHPERTTGQATVAWPFASHTPEQKLAPAPAKTANEKLDVNTASEAQLEELTGIGPVLAERIIAARPLQSADELRKVKGIGETKFAQVRPYFQ